MSKPYQVTQEQTEPTETRMIMETLEEAKARLAKEAEEEIRVKPKKATPKKKAPKKK